MRTEVLGNLDSVVTAVYYIWKGNLLFPPEWNISVGKFIPTEIIPKAEVIQYKSSSSSIDWKDFKEYNYKLFPDKNKYTDYNIMDWYGDKAREYIGHDPEDIEKFSKYALPTIYADQEEDIDITGYFKSKVLSSGKAVYQFQAPENCYKIELYSEVLDSVRGNAAGNIIADTGYESKGTLLYSKHPVISIFLGPTNDNILNPDKFYYGNNGRPSEMKVLTTASEYRKLIEEITCAKVITLVSSVGGASIEESSISINISQTCFYDSKNPLRNLKTIALRNDEWQSSVNSVNQIGVKNGGLYDLTAGTLIGNEKITKTPILDFKRKLVNSGKSYAQDHTYSKGDVITLGHAEYISVTDNNKGNQPLISPTWILKSNFDSSFTKSIDLIITPLYSGHSSKSSLTYTSDSINKSFEFVPEHGFELNQDTFLNKPDAIRTGAENLIVDVDFEYQETLSIEGKVTRKIIIKDWEKILKTGKIIISPEVKSKKCFIRLLYKDKYYYLFDIPRLEKYPTNQYISGNDIYLNSKAITNEEMLNVLSATSSSSSLDISRLNTEALSVSDIIANYTYSDLSTKEVYLKRNNDTFLDTEISSEVVYTICMEDRKYNCRVYYNTENWEVEETCPVGHYNMPLTIRFYSINVVPLKKVTVYDETGDHLLYSFSNVTFTEGIYSVTIPAILENHKIFIVD